MTTLASRFRSTGKVEIRPIPSIPGAFANSLGQVKFPLVKKEPYWTFGRRRVKKYGYAVFMAAYKSRQYIVARLICEAFHGPPPFYRAHAMHGDEDSGNNFPANLKWGTSKQNCSAPGWRAKNAIIQRVRSPLMLQRAIEGLRRAWNDPEKRERLLAIRRSGYLRGNVASQSTTARALRSASLRAAWRDPVKRARLLGGRNKAKPD